MLRRTSTIIVTAVALLTLPPAARSQTLTPPPTPESHLLEAKRLLGDIAASPNTEIGKQIAALQIDFTELATTYFSGGQASAPKSAPSGAVGTSGTVIVDWHPKYAAVEKDLTRLIGAPDAPSADQGTPSLDPGVRKHLADVRRNLQLFYASTMGRREPPTAEASTVSPPAPAPAPPPAAPIADQDTGTIAALLDRMEALVDTVTGANQKSGAVGTSGSLSKSGKIEVERQSLDELRAEIAQLKTMLAKKP